MEEKKKLKLKWFLILLVLPIILMVWASKQIWNQKWDKKYRIGAIVILWGAVIIYGSIANQNYQQKQKALSVQHEQGNQGGCIGPDGKRIQLGAKECEEFNNAWKNKPQENKQEAVNISTVQPISADSSNIQPTSVTSKNISTPSNTPVPQVNLPVQTNSNDIYSVLKENAKQKWGADYEMVQYTYNNQAEAYNWVVAQTEYPEIMTSAKNKWGDDYEMVKYEYENQVEAYKKL